MKIMIKLKGGHVAIKSPLSGWAWHKTNLERRAALKRVIRIFKESEDKARTRLEKTFEAFLVDTGKRGDIGKTITRGNVA